MAITERTIYKAYDKTGDLVAQTWTSAIGAGIIEREMYQSLLNKGHYFTVEIIPPYGPVETLHPKRKESDDVAGDHDG